MAGAEGLEAELDPLTGIGDSPDPETIFSPGCCALPIGDCDRTAVGDEFAAFVATAGDCIGFDSTF